MTGWLADLRIALRLLRRRPGWTASVLVTLALAIGANSALFSVLDATLAPADAVPGARAPGAHPGDRAVLPGDVGELSRLRRLARPDPLLRRDGSVPRGGGEPDGDGRSPTGTRRRGIGELLPRARGAAAGRAHLRGGRGSRRGDARGRPHRGHGAKALRSSGCFSWTRAAGGRDLLDGRRSDAVRLPRRATTGALGPGGAADGGPDRRARKPPRADGARPAQAGGVVRRGPAGSRGRGAGAAGGIPGRTGPCCPGPTRCSSASRRTCGARSGS